MDVIFQSTNNVGTLVGFKPSTLGRTASYWDQFDHAAEDMGACAALGALWLMNMITYIDPSVTKPAEFQAALIQTKLRQGFRAAGAASSGGQAQTKQDKFMIGAMAAVGLKELDVIDSPNFYDMFKVINVTPGYFFINLLCGHAIAAVNRGTDRFLYDSNQGMCRIDTATFPTEAIQNIGMGRYADNGARAYLVAANN